MEAEKASKKGMNSTDVSGSLKNSFDAGKVSAARNSRRNGIRGMSQPKMRNILMEKAQKEICKKLHGGRRVLESLMSGSVKPGPKEIVDSETNNNYITADSEEPLSVSMSVPDPDFHDFDANRIEDTFGENQVRAAYDDEDGMACYYAFIQCDIKESIPSEDNLAEL
ncbi:unnamed protein product [Vicia faba]|uniref:DUF3444 domain-containing protein n=1 Tax=Vicia faba TaxID=3906 RepID=A0AAV0ZZU3_VICFA|nr:unnamed protein product [Vicia faba]